MDLTALPTQSATNMTTDQNTPLNSSNLASSDNMTSTAKAEDGTSQKQVGGLPPEAKAFSEFLDVR